MSVTGKRPRRVAGARTPGASEVVHVDYHDVLAQAVENARFQALREVEEAVSAILTHKPRERTYSPPAPREAQDFQRDALSAIRRLRTD